MRPFTFQSSSMVEHAAVNRVVVGSSPTSGANLCNGKNLVSAISAKPQLKAIGHFAWLVQLAWL